MRRHSKDRSKGKDRDDEREPRLSAQVVLRALSGKVLDGDTVITSQNIRDYAPSADDTEAARAAFQAAGFDVGELVGISFAITAPRAAFERLFQAELAVEKGHVRVVGASDPEQQLLPLGKLPRSLAGSLVAVTFTPPAQLFV